MVPRATSSQTCSSSYHPGRTDDLKGIRFAGTERKQADETLRESEGRDLELPKGLQNLCDQFSQREGTPVTLQEPVGLDG